MSKSVAVASTSKQNIFEDEDIFDDSSFIEKFQDTSFHNKTSGANNALNNSGLNISALCYDEEISGYDKLMGRTWIYPTNYPVRDYQFNIINAALLKNTLVSLPTGLGKTFIAAVIMYNFYRWYPLGKIVFTAPTRPLVAQQIDACYNIVAIPPNTTIEMTGHMPVNTRKEHWKNKRVFFATPQVIYNDIKSGICPGDLIRCLVIDEAHRARGNYAYCQIVSALTDMGHNTYRMLALSATPGSKVDDVVNVVRNLHISHLELRTERCIDVAPYGHARTVYTELVPLGAQLTRLRQLYVEILDAYARRLKSLNILPHNIGNMSKGRILMLYKEFQNKERGARHPQHNSIMRDFTVLISLYHGLELLVRHGARVFLNFFDDHPEKAWIQSDDRLTELLERLRDDLGVNPMTLNRSALPDGTAPEIPKDIRFGHPKFDKLKEIMLRHFTAAKEKGQETKAIVFCEYRESVSLVHLLLLQCRPLITALMFVGQGGAAKDRPQVSQKQQLLTLSRFVSGAANALVATCVAEEGLDAGAVDLVVCFDVASRAPGRLVQRCGRTGRQRGGQVYILVTEGKEHQTLLDCIRQRDGLNDKIMHSKEIEASLYTNSPRMVPRGHRPALQKMYITVAERPAKERTAGGRKGQKDLRSMLGRKSLPAGAGGAGGGAGDGAGGGARLSEREYRALFPAGFAPQWTVPAPEEYWTCDYESFQRCIPPAPPPLATWLEWQRAAQPTVGVRHSRDTDVLCHLLQLCDEKRFGCTPQVQGTEPSTQPVVLSIPSPAKTKVVKKKQKQPADFPTKKDGDIRALFSTATKSTKSYTKLISDLGIPDDGTISTNLINLIVDMTLDKANVTNKCLLCLYVCKCSTLWTKDHSSNGIKSVLTTVANAPKLPDLDLIDDINPDTLERFKMKKISNKEELCTELLEVFVDGKEKSVAGEDLKNKANCSTNFDLEFDFGSPVDAAENAKEPCENIMSETDKNFDLGDIEDIFAESSPEEAIVQELQKEDDKINTSQPKEALQFFGLDSIEDIFADSDDSTEDNKEVVLTKCTKSTKSEDHDITSTKEVVKIQINEQNNLPPRSPSILSGRSKIEAPTSPILCTQPRRFQLSSKQKLHTSTPRSAQPKQLFHSTDNNVKTVDLTNVLPNHDATKQSSASDNSKEKSMFTITQIVEMINKSDHDKPNVSNKAYNSDIIIDEARSPSPILLSQVVKKKIENKIPGKRKDSLIVLDSESSSDETVSYEINVKENENIADMKAFNTPPKLTQQIQCKSEAASPYFKRSLKQNCTEHKPLSLQEKIIAALKTNKDKERNFNEDRDVHFAFPTSPILLSQKENHSPNCYKIPNKSQGPSMLDKLKAFKHEPKRCVSQKDINKVNGCDKDKWDLKTNSCFDDFSDDDFITDSKKDVTIQSSRPKPKKIKKRAPSLLDLSARVSDGSADELSDGSAGSLADFVCDDEPAPDERMHAVYLRSVRSPVRGGGFKIPELPKRFDREEIFSQFVEQDSYELDSFCVDSHVGLTQSPRVCELERAERALRRRKRRRSPAGEGEPCPPAGEGEPRPPAGRRHKRLRISSGSDDSS